MFDLKTHLADGARWIETALDRLVLPADTRPASLHAAMRHSLFAGGKRLRPLLCAACAEACGAPRAAALFPAAAIECLHTYTLIHDDLPCMDDDDLRRGVPTCHKAYGEATALLAGDALQTLAFELLSRPTGLPGARQLRMLSTLAQAAGSLGMAGGQAIDLANVGKAMNQAALEQMHSLKTGALIRAAVALGALSCPDVDDEGLARLDDYARKLGLAFQVIDDVLDCEADTATLGKTAGKDADADKPTYVKLMGLPQARAYAEALVAEAVAALAPFGEKAAHLRGLAEFVTARKH